MTIVSPAKHRRDALEQPVHNLRGRGTLISLTTGVDLASEHLGGFPDAAAADEE
jgi:hypothetical protein